ncbi:MAG: NAD-dependent protein deacylase [Tissierellia bacterium]|nr:NAD-dependent protein deacylase [Tissierellia bacterium]
MGKIDELREILKDSDNIVFFGGAGVSTESNIPDFRSASGLYNTKSGVGKTPEYMLSHTCLVRDTEDFYNYYRENILHPEAKPNRAHEALAKLEEMGKLKAVITQNIDGLHQLAGSKNVMELHGSVLKNYCAKCGKKYDVHFIYDSEGIPTCECGGLVRPDVVLYEEALNNKAMSDAVAYIEGADTLIIGGTSLVVYPAAGLVRYFRGKNLILINKSQTSYDRMATLAFNESIGDVLSEAVIGI